MSPKVLAALLCSLAVPPAALGAAPPPPVKAAEGSAAPAAKEAATEGLEKEAGEVASEGAEVAEEVATSGFAQGFMAGFSEAGGIAEEEVLCIRTTSKNIMTDLAETMKDLQTVVLEFQVSQTDAQGEIRKIIGEILETVELMKSLVTECMNQEARQKVKEEIKTLLVHLTSFTYMKDTIVTQYKTIEQDILVAVTEMVNKHYEEGGEAIGKAMQVLLNSPPEAVAKYSVEDDSVLGRMFRRGANYHAPVLIAFGVVFVLLAVLQVTRLRRARKVRTPTFSRSSGSEGVQTDYVDTEAPRSAAPLVAAESDGEAVE